ncbi:MAG: hypothetical protein Q8Q42_01960, partial [Nanoarchaeota archaeon]|nr:hypothetical protein [Nanoarchaeota archaeon]
KRLKEAMDQLGIMKKLAEEIIKESQKNRQSKKIKEKAIDITNIAGNLFYYFYEGDILAEIIYAADMMIDLGPRISPDTINPKIQAEFIIAKIKELVGKPIVITD